jgi:hypothetical protein
MRLVQLRRRETDFVAVVEEPQLRVLDGLPTIFLIAQAAAASKKTLSDLVKTLKTKELIGYDDVYANASEWKLQTPISAFPASSLLVSGTGLTHLGSARDRQNMHSGPIEQLTDSMKMFRWGLENGKPSSDQIGVAPEWFYKGNSTILRAHNEPLDIPSHAEDGGEEAEIAGIYTIGDGGVPYRIGMAIGNEFSDHKFEKRNYLNLAGSKLRTCSIGPEIVIDPEFKSVPGQVTIERNGKTLWTKSILTGEDEMCHSLANIEHHHFKFEAHRKPGDVHVHFYGACSLSFGDGIELLDGDIMQIAFEGFGRPLRNPVRKASTADALVSVKTLA